MDLNSKYLSNLEDSEVRRGGFLYSKENTKYPDGFPKDKSLPIDDKIYRDVIRISFNELYHNLLVRLYDADVFKKFNIKIDKAIVDRVRDFTNDDTKSDVVSCLMGLKTKGYRPKAITGDPVEVIIRLGQLSEVKN